MSGVGRTLGILVSPLVTSRPDQAQPLLKRNGVKPGPRPRDGGPSLILMIPAGRAFVKRLAMIPGLSGFRNWGRSGPLRN